MNNTFFTRRIRRTASLAVLVLVISLTANSQDLKPSSSGLAPVNGAKIWYEVYGSGKPLVLIHGAFMTAQGNWAEMLPELSKTRKVIAFEMQGHGHSPYVERKISVENMADDVSRAMAYLKIDSADVVGYSMGGTVAWQLAIANPKKVTSLVIISSTYKSNGWIPEINAAFKEFKPELFDGSPMQVAYNSVAPDSTKWRSFIGQMVAYVNTPFDLGDANIAKIRVPVLLIAGDNDGLDKEQLAKTYKLLGGGVSADMMPMPSAKLAIVPGQSHVGVMMQTVTILAYLKDFLKL